MKNPNRIRKTAEDYAVNVICIVFGVLLALACIYPIYYTLINSLNEGTDAAKGGIYLWPRVFSLKNYEVVFRDNDLPLSFLLTVVRTLLGTVLALVYTTAVSYALSRRELIGRKFYLMTGMVTMYISGGVIPTYMLYRSLGLINSFWVYILPSMYSFGNAILMLNFFKKLPVSLIESAKLDGAGEWQIFWRICMPQCRAALYSIAILVFIDYWNMVEQPLILLPDASQQPLSVYLSQINAGEIGIAFAAAVVYMIPGLLLFLHGEAYLVEGIAYSGSVKG